MQQVIVHITRRQIQKGRDDYWKFKKNSTQTNPVAVALNQVVPANWTVYTEEISSGKYRPINTPNFLKGWLVQFNRWCHRKSGRPKPISFTLELEPWQAIRMDQSTQS